MQRMGYLHRLTILKEIAAGQGDVVCTQAGALTINGRWRAPVLERDPRGRQLPQWRGCRALAKDEFFVFSDRIPNSFDSRYYGPVKRAQIVGVFQPCGHSRTHMEELMDAAALAGLCAFSRTMAPPNPPGVPEGVSCPAADHRRRRLVEVALPAGLRRTSLARAIGSADARDGIARVAYAEAANQGDSGLAAVVYTILNRLEDGRWGASVDAVLDAPHQFEPVMRAGGSWRNLRPVSEAQRARIDTILNLALDGRLPDLTNGARFFQNPKIVGGRAANGQVAATW